MQFGMDFGYDNGSAKKWDGSTDLEPMYAAYRKQAAYIVDHGFTWSNISGNPVTGITDNSLLHALGILAGSGLDICLWLVPQAEPGWDINGRDIDPIYSAFEHVIRVIDAVPYIAKRVKMIACALEIHLHGSEEELHSFLSWYCGMIRGWLAETDYMQNALLTGGLSSSRTLSSVPRDGGRLSAIAPYVDIVSISEYSPTDAISEMQRETWRQYEDGYPNPFILSEMNNGARKYGDLVADYNEENHFGYVSWRWLVEWGNLGAQITFLHRGNNTYPGAAYAWFDGDGEPLPWLIELADHIKKSRLLEG